MLIAGPKMHYCLIILQLFVEGPVNMVKDKSKYIYGDNWYMHINYFLHKLA